MSVDVTDAPTPSRREHWLLVAYYANCAGRASSHHVDDRIDEFSGHGIDVTLLSSPCGGSYGSRVRHLRAPSPWPSGFLYELGMRFRRARRSRGTDRVLQLAGIAASLPIALVALPGQALERLAGEHDKRWHWWLSAVVRALPTVWRHPPDVVYTIGGPSASHEAGRRIARLAGARLVCQFQDPLPFQYPPSHPWRHRFHERLEQTLAAEADPLVFLTGSAAAAARERLPPGTPVFANLAGAVPRAAGAGARGPGTVVPASASAPATPRTIAHLGTLAGARNLDALFAALSAMAADDPALGARFRLRLAGTLDRYVHDSIESFALRDSVEVLGRLERPDALALADGSDVLLLVQGNEEVSLETIPSKAYEYLSAARPVLALVDDNTELVELLRAHGHLAVRFGEGRGALTDALDTVIRGELPSVRPSELTSAASVRRLVARVREPTRATGQPIGRTGVPL